MGMSGVGRDGKDAGGRERRRSGWPPGPSRVSPRPHRLSPPGSRRQCRLDLGNGHGGGRHRDAPGGRPRPRPVPTRVRGQDPRGPGLAWPGTRRSSAASLRAGPSPLRQSDSPPTTRPRWPPHARGLVYGCDCSRTTIAAQSGMAWWKGRASLSGHLPRPRAGSRTRRGRAHPAAGGQEAFDDLRLGPAAPAAARSSAGICSPATGTATGPISSR